MDTIDDYVNRNQLKPVDYLHDAKEKLFECTADRGEYAKVVVQPSESNDACILSIQESTDIYVSAILEKKTIRKLRDYLSELLNQPVKK